MNREVVSIPVEGKGIGVVLEGLGGIKVKAAPDTARMSQHPRGFGDSFRAMRNKSKKENKVSLTAATARDTGRGNPQRPARSITLAAHSTGAEVNRHATARDQPCQTWAGVLQHVICRLADAIPTAMALLLWLTYLRR
jgi:hypothetical protein